MATTWYSLQLDRTEHISDNIDDLKALAYKFMEEENMAKAVEPTYLKWWDMNEAQQFQVCPEEDDIVFSYKFSKDARIVGALFLDEELTYMPILTMTDDLERFTKRQTDIAAAFSELWDLMVENEETDFTPDLGNLWDKICDAEGMPHWSADEII